MPKNSAYERLVGGSPVVRAPETSERQGVVMRKSKEGLYVTQTEYNFYLEEWENMRSQSEVIEGPENSPITYSNTEMVGLSTDCRSLTKTTSGIAIAGDQQSLIADLIIDLEG